ncbi:MAG: SWIM zinc finger family protein [Desulfobacterales bacterium]
MAGDAKKEADLFRELTWGDLTVWVGREAVTRGTGLQKQGAVENLVKTSDGGLMAWVSAEEIFASHVGFEQGELFCRCACQGGTACEHAIAVILEYIAFLKKNRHVPIAAANDQRFYLV